MNVLESIVEELTVEKRGRIVRFRVSAQAIEGVVTTTPVVDYERGRFKLTTYEIVLHPMDMMEAMKLRDPLTGVYPYEVREEGRTTLYLIPVVREA